MFPLWEWRRYSTWLKPQYSSQIVETGAICLEFSPNFLYSLLTPSLSVKCTPLLPQCWATRILEHWDDCNTQINIGEGENHTSISRFVTSIAATLSWLTNCFVGATNWKEVRAEYRLLRGGRDFNSRVVPVHVRAKLHRVSAPYVY